MFCERCCVMPLKKIVFNMLFDLRWNMLFQILYKMYVTCCVPWCLTCSVICLWTFGLTCSVIFCKPIVLYAACSMAFSGFGNYTYYQCLIWRLNPIRLFNKIPCKEEGWLVGLWQFISRISSGLSYL